MKWFLLLYAWVPILFFIWHRLPGGRSTSESGLPDIKGLKEFDVVNPEASDNLRRAFYTAVQAHLSGDLSEARRSYIEVLSIVPKDPTTRHNLDLLDKQQGLEK
jgi:hypothetical protein